MVCGIGSIFGGMNTMYAAVARRTREVGVLRSLGFGRGTVLVSFVIESAILGLLGGVLGEILGVAVATLTGLNSRVMSIGNLMYTFTLAPPTFVAGLVAAVAIGLLGGMLPAWHASRIGVTE